MASSNSLIEIWPKMQEKLHMIFPSRCSSFATIWKGEILDLIMMMKLLPASNVGKNAKGVEKIFEKATEKLIVFVQVRQFHSF